RSPAGSAWVTGSGAVVAVLPPEPPAGGFEPPGELDPPQAAGRMAAAARSAARRRGEGGMVRGDASCAPSASAERPELAGCLTDPQEAPATPAAARAIPSAISVTPPTTRSRWMR